MMEEFIQHRDGSELVGLSWWAIRHQLWKILPIEEIERVVNSIAIR
jgi:hypothetical protein